MLGSKGNGGRTLLALAASVLLYPVSDGRADAIRDGGGQTSGTDPATPVASVKLSGHKRGYTMEIRKLTPDDLTDAPRAHRLGGVTQPLIGTSFWGAPVSTGAPRDTWGRPIGEPQRGMLQIASPLLRLDAGLILLQASDTPSGNAKVLETGNWGPLRSYPVAGDPSGVTNDPFTRVQESTTRGTGEQRYTWSTRQATQTNRGFRVTWDSMPYAMVIKPGYLYQPAYGHGTYNGKPIEMMGGFDRAFGLTSYILPVRDWKTALWSLSAKRQDGKYEYGWICLSWNGRKPKYTPPVAAVGFFHREGEEPVVSNNVKIENLTWQNPRGPGPGIIPLHAKFTFGGKEIEITTDQGLYPVKLSRPLPPGYNLLNLGLLAAGVNDSWGTWREKESPPFRLSKAGVETHFLYRGDAG